MAANDSFFRNQNGGCGYILKPDYLRSISDTPFNPSDPKDLAVVVVVVVVVVVFVVVVVVVHVTIWWPLWLCL